MFHDYTPLGVLVVDINNNITSILCKICRTITRMLTCPDAPGGGGREQPGCKKIMIEQPENRRVWQWWVIGSSSVTVWKVQDGLLLWF